MPNRRRPEAGARLVQLLGDLQFVRDFDQQGRRLSQPSASQLLRTTSAPAGGLFLRRRRRMPSRVRSRCYFAALPAFLPSLAPARSKRASSRWLGRREHADGRSSRGPARQLGRQPDEGEALKPALATPVDPKNLDDRLSSDERRSRTCLAKACNAIQIIWCDRRHFYVLQQALMIQVPRRHCDSIVAVVSAFTLLIR